MEVCDAAQSKLAHYVGNIDNAIGQAVDLLKRAAMASMHIRKASNIRVIRGVGGWFKRPKKCLTPSEDENSKNRLKIWQIPIQS